MIYVFLVLSIFLFVGCIKGFGVVQKVSHVISEARESLSVMSSTLISDEKKEVIIQTASIKMLGSFFSILGRVGASVGIAGGCAMLGTVLGFYTLQEVITTTSDWYFICGSTVAMCIGWYIFK
jgi:hypothetical protein